MGPNPTEKLERVIIPTYGLTYGSLKRYLDLKFPEDDVAIDQSAVSDNYKFYVSGGLKKDKLEDISYMRAASSDEVKIFLDMKAIEKTQKLVDIKTDARTLQKEFNSLIKRLNDHKRYLKQNYENWGEVVLGREKSLRGQSARDMWMECGIEMCKLYRTWMINIGRREVNEKVEEMKAELGLNKDETDLKEDLKKLDEELKKLDAELKKLDEKSKAPDQDEKPEQGKKPEQDKTPESSKKLEPEDVLKIHIAEREKKAEDVRQKKKELKEKKEKEKAARKTIRDPGTPETEDFESSMKDLFQKKKEELLSSSGKHCG